MRRETACINYWKYYERKKILGEAHRDETANFARERFMQRDAQVEVLSVN